MRKAFTIAAATLALLWLTLPQAMAQAPIKSSGTVMHSGAIVASPQLSSVHQVDMNSPEAKLKLEATKNQDVNPSLRSERSGVSANENQPPVYDKSKVKVWTKEEWEKNPNKKMPDANAGDLDK